MRKINIYLKSGNIIEVVCESWEFKVDNLTGGFIGYNLKDFKNFKHISIDPTCIEAYTVEDQASGE